MFFATVTKTYFEGFVKVCNLTKLQQINLLHYLSASSSAELSPVLFPVPSAKGPVNHVCGRVAGLWFPTAEVLQTLWLYMKPLHDN